MFIPDQKLSIQDPGFRVKNILAPGSASKEKLSWMFIPDPDFSPSRIQTSKKHRILDPDPQHWVNRILYFGVDVEI
jgi:hypothetical protein